MWPTPASFAAREGTGWGHIHNLCIEYSALATLSPSPLSTLALVFFPLWELCLAD